MTSCDDKAHLETASVLNVPVGVVTMDRAIQQVNQWAGSTGAAKLVTFVNVHMLVEAQLRPEFKHTLHRMDLNCPDGAPVFWLARRGRSERVSKIAGPAFMPLFLAQSVKHGHRHFLYGGAPGVAREAEIKLRSQYPNIQIVGHYSPPFRPLTRKEMDEVAVTINESKADIVWVSLGCPKQEQWISEFRDLLNVKVILAVGQALNITAGQVLRCPPFVTALGAEWLYRLFQEPRRLWKRYLVTNTLFLLFLLQQRFNGGRGPVAGA